MVGIAEIVDFCDFLSPTPEEQVARDAALYSIFDVIKYIWPACRPEVFGSFRIGLYLSTSDIDVVILESGIKNPQTGLYALSRALSQRGIAKKMQETVLKWPQLRPLCLILKVFLQQRDLNEVCSGGIGSYALLAMIIAMLQLWRPICTVRSYIFIAQMIRSFRITLSPFLYCQNPKRCDL
ncbi:hypothetical protein CXB51_031349 [Gossypium anomalum]|uniref:Poly(A) RNA polymerase mitochondrial-like central palm domain-containing protein n=1 Tax=Gossypium anomalum TaxID=47600 RepID=A0A8J5XSX0_9ROSI|nr:hypothetical protein CXB51_031349 [Gossypium anomalum]